MNNLQNVREQVERLAAEIGASSQSFPGFGSAKYDSAPYVEIHGPTYHYLSMERDQERTHYITFDVDELLYWVFSDITHNMGFAYAEQNPNREKDLRKAAFEQQLNLLEKLNPSWRLRREREIAEILKSSPYTS
jgi:hypothetical protein